MFLVLLSHMKLFGSYGTHQKLFFNLRWSSKIFSASCHASLELMTKGPNWFLILTWTFFFALQKWTKSALMIYLKYSSANNLMGTYLGNLKGKSSHPYILISVWFWYRDQSPILYYLESFRIFFMSPLILGGGAPINRVDAGCTNKSMNSL